MSTERRSVSSSSRIPSSTSPPRIIIPPLLTSESDRSTSNVAGSEATSLKPVVVSIGSMGPSFFRELAFLAACSLMASFLDFLSDAFAKGSLSGSLSSHSSSTTWLDGGFCCFEVDISSFLASSSFSDIASCASSESGSARRPSSGGVSLTFLLNLSKRPILPPNHRELARSLFFSWSFSWVRRRYYWSLVPSARQLIQWLSSSR